MKLYNYAKRDTDRNNFGGDEVPSLVCAAMPMRAYFCPSSRCDVIPHQSTFPASLSCLRLYPRLVHSAYIFVCTLFSCLPCLPVSTAISVLHSLLPTRPPLPLLGIFCSLLLPPFSLLVPRSHPIPLYPTAALSHLPLLPWATRVGPFKPPPPPRPQITPRIPQTLAAPAKLAKNLIALQAVQHKQGALHKNSEVQEF